jgi:predicted KAP-like P-loop ATPase
MAKTGMAATPKILTYHSDAPICDPSEDAFERWPFAQRIGDTIAKRTDPANLCVGIYGRWGEGKSTILRFIERHLSGHTDIRIIHFNPWRFRTEEDLFVGFFGALAGGIGGSIKTKRERAAKAVAPYTKLLGPVSVGAFGGHLSAAELAKGLAEAASADVETLKGRLDKLIKESKKKLVIFVDDIDRMDRAQVHAVFKLIKACGDFLYTTYILAFDDKAIAAALGTQYGEGDIRWSRLPRKNCTSSAACSGSFQYISTSLLLEGGRPRGCSRAC